MKKFHQAAVVLLALSVSVWASNSMQDYQGNWNDPNGWSEGRAPSGAEEVKVRGSTECTLNTSTGDWGPGQRLRVYEGATLNIEDGAELLGAGWFRIGADGSSGTVNQTGGLVMVQDGKDTAKLVVGDKVGTHGVYNISGGTMTYNSAGGGDLVVGGRQSTGTLRVIGSAPVIQMNGLLVGERIGATGTLVFQLDANGVSPITLAGDCILDGEEADSNAFLVIEAIDVPPMDEIVLIDLSEGASLSGAFDNVAEGNDVQVKVGGDLYFYTLTFHGGDDGLDVALQYKNRIPEPMDPGVANLTHAYDFEDGTARDRVGSADGTLVGSDVNIVDVSLVISAQDSWLELPGDVIDINSYEAVTLQIWYTPQAGANTSWSMLAYFGDSVNGLGANGLFMTSARGDDKSRAAISCGNLAAPWTAETGVDGPEYDDGRRHHMAMTIDSSELSFYIDGFLMGTALLSENNRLSAVSNNLALLGKGGYSGDPEWIGSIDEFSIYNRALSAAEIAYLAGYRAEPYAPLPDAVVATYPFKDGAVDTSGNGQDGTLLGQPVLVYGPDDYGFAYLFNGAGSGDAIDTPIAFAPAGSFSLALWIQPWAWAGNSLVADIDGSGQGLEVAGVADSGRLAFHTTGLGTTADTDGALQSLGAAPLDQWTHVTVVYDAEANQKRIYLNGVLDNVGDILTDSVYSPSSQTLKIGARPTADGLGVENSFNGIIDEVVVYQRVLSQGEILYLSAVSD